MGRPADDRERIVRMASRKGWEIAPQGRNLDLRKGDRTLTALFDNDWNLVSFRVGTSPVRGGIQGILLIMERV